MRKQGQYFVKPPGGVFMHYSDPKGWIVACWTGKYWQVPGYNNLIGDKELLYIDEKPLIRIDPEAKTTGHGVVSVAEQVADNKVLLPQLPAWNTFSAADKDRITLSNAQALQSIAIQMQRIANILQKQSDE